LFSQFIEISPEAANWANSPLDLRIFYATGPKMHSNFVEPGLYDPLSRGSKQLFSARNGFKLYTKNVPQKNFVAVTNTNTQELGM